MSNNVVTQRLMTDATGQAIATALGNLAPANVYMDIPVSIQVSDWSVSAPYEYTWTNAHITSECTVEVMFADGADNVAMTYIEYDKVAGGVKFTVPKVPSASIPVVVRIINAKADFVVSDLTADQIGTEAVSGVSNVEQALSNIDGRVDTLNSNITPETITFTPTSNIDSSNSLIHVIRIGKLWLLSGYFKVTTAIAANSGQIGSIAKTFPINSFGICYQNSDKPYGIILQTNGVLRADDKTIPTGFKNFMIWTYASS